MVLPMSTREPTFYPILAVTSSTALLAVGGKPALIRSFEGLRKFWPSSAITVAVNSSDAKDVSDIFAKNGISDNLLVCEIDNPSAFAESLASAIENFDAVLIHDASRPLTSNTQFESVISSFTDFVDAVRPASAFTETLKILGPNETIKGTLDRTTVKRISTPEVIRIAAIDLEGEDVGWFVPLKMGARIKYVDSALEGLRINTAADRDLLELFLS